MKPSTTCVAYLWPWTILNSIPSYSSITVDSLEVGGGRHSRRTALLL